MTRQQSWVLRCLDAVGSRRIIFLLLALVLVVVMLLPAGSGDLEITAQTQKIYDTIETLPPGSPVLVSFDFDPPSKPELYPACRAVLRHLFRKKQRVFIMCLWPAAKGLVTEALQVEAPLARARSSPGGENAYPADTKDYVFLGFLAGEDAAIVRLTEGVPGAFPTDDLKRPTQSMPIWTGGDGRRVDTLRDFSLVVSFSAGFPGTDEWIRLGRSKGAIPIATAVTGVTAPTKMPFYLSGQIIGLVNGMRGAAEYELLVNRSTAPDDTSPPLTYGLAGMPALSASHFLVIGLVVVSNLLYFLQRKGDRR